jgi:hypothetical protein
MEAETKIDSRLEVERFLAILFEPTDLVEIRTFHRDSNTNQVRQFWRNVRVVEKLLPELHLLNQEGEHNIYIGANPRLREGGSSDDVALARSLYADWDDVEADAIDSLLSDSGLPIPTLVVHSGHGLHAYWRLVSPITDLGVFKAAQVKIIEKTKSDPKLKDPPRVMRLPGFINLADPRKDEADGHCRIVRADAGAMYELEQIVGKIEAEPLRAPTPLPSNKQDRMQLLSRNSVQFVAFGAAEGERNAKLFATACDMAGCGWTYDDAISELYRPAVASGLPEGEVEATVRSAFDKPRSPSTPEDTEIASALQRAADQPKSTAPDLVLPPSVKPGRSTISNVVDAETSDGESVRYYTPLPQIAMNVSEAMGGWPRRVGGQLFAVDEQLDDLPDMRAVRWIKKPEALFAWMGGKCDIRWSTGESKHQVRKGSRLNPPTKQEMFAYFVDGPLPNYRAVEILPHHPPVKGLYYLPCKLPVVPVPDGNATPLQELINRFNPETELDRRLMLCALLTPGWGGPPGTRPAFVFTSDHGRGSGKTTTANVMADVWGGAMGISVKEDIDKVRGRLLGDDSLTKRIALIDNIKGRMSNSDIEGFITSKEFDGWKPYVGQASRPNYMTWYLTANSPSLSRDLADRSVVIKVGKQAHSTSFIAWATDWVNKHRAMILAELIEVLRGEPLVEIETKNRDRWAGWQDAILTRFEDGNELATLIRDRRGTVDADTEDADEIAEVVLRMVSDHFGDHQQRRIMITYQQLYNRLVKDGVTDKNFGPRQCISWIKEKCGNGPLSFLKPSRTDQCRGWMYVGLECATQLIDYLPETGEDFMRKSA